MGRNWTRKSIEELVRQYATSHGYGPGPGPVEGVTVEYPIAYANEIIKYCKYSKEGYLDSYGYEMDISDDIWREEGLTPYVDSSLVFGGLEHFAGGAGIVSFKPLTYFQPILDEPSSYLPVPYDEYTMDIYCYINGVFQKMSLMTLYSYGIDTSSMTRLLTYSQEGNYAYVYKIRGPVWNAFFEMILDIEQKTGTKINNWYILYRNMCQSPYDLALPRIPEHICDIAWNAVPEYNGVKEE